MRLGVVGEGLQVPEEALPVGHDVLGRTEFPGGSVQMVVDAEPFRAGVGEDTKVPVAVQGSAAGHRLHDEGIDAPTQNSDAKEGIGSHQAIFP